MRYRLCGLVVLCIVLGFCFESCTKNSSSEIKVTGGKDAENQVWGFGVVRIGMWFDTLDEDGSPRGGYCTASVVSHNTLLTAAHCVTDETSDGSLVSAVKVVADYKISQDQQKFYRSEFEGVGYNRSYKNAFEQEKGEKYKPSSPYDMAIVKFADNTFKDIVPLQIASQTVGYDSEVISIGYGCKTEVRKEGNWNIVDCAKEDSRSLKRWGYTTLTKSTYCPATTIQVSQKNPTADSLITNPTGQDVAINHGDSGGPLLEFFNGRWSIAGVCALMQGLYKKNKESCYSNPRLQDNYSFLYRAVQKLGAYIPGIHMSLGVIELNGKIRVVEKLYSNAYNQGVVQIPLTLAFIKSSSQSCSSLKSIEDLKTCWSKFRLHERTTTKWQ